MPSNLKEYITNVGILQTKFILGLISVITIILIILIIYVFAVGQKENYLKAYITTGIVVVLIGVIGIVYSRIPVQKKIKEHITPSSSINNFNLEKILRKSF